MNRAGLWRTQRFTQFDATDLERHRAVIVSSRRMIRLRGPSSDEAAIARRERRVGARFSLAPASAHGSAPDVAI